MPTIVVHIVDDDPSFLTSTDRLLRASGYHVMMYESAQQLLEQLPDSASPGCLLLDMQMPGLSGSELQRRLAELEFSLPIVFLSGSSDIPTSVQAMKSGADDFLTKPVSKETLVDAIERAVARSRMVQKARGRLDTSRRLIATLTPREHQVFERVVQGKMNKEIARELGTSARTVKAHRQKVMEKVRVESLTELVLVAERLGILAALDTSSHTSSEHLQKPQDA
jgi:FixJ family two-component response regulator